MGWSIDPVSSKATPWGGDPLFVAMRAANPSQLLGQAIDYGTMFHTEYMLMKRGGAGLDPAKQSVVNSFLAARADKVVLRRLLKDIFVWSLRELFLVVYCYDSLLKLLM